jgi:hypothetical protein
MIYAESKGFCEAKILPADKISGENNRVSWFPNF